MTNDEMYCAEGMRHPQPQKPIYWCDGCAHFRSFAGTTTWPFCDYHNRTIYNPIGCSNFNNKT